MNYLAETAEEHKSFTISKTPKEDDGLGTNERQGFPLPFYIGPGVLSLIAIMA